MKSFPHKLRAAEISINFGGDVFITPPQPTPVPRCWLLQGMFSSPRETLRTSLLCDVSTSGEMIPLSATGDGYRCWRLYISLPEFTIFFSNLPTCPIALLQFCLSFAKQLLLFSGTVNVLLNKSYLSAAHSKVSLDSEISCQNCWGFF